MTHGDDVAAVLPAMAAIVRVLAGLAVVVVMVPVALYRAERDDSEHHSGGCQ
ncbi:MAG TPA: hypothetical protein VKR31_10155 [Rhizomicrobium sp.]|nr:hypothetical protein [Rhizomicrobium sp.]